MQLAIGLLIFSGIMLLAVGGFTFRDARNRRALTQKIKTLEEELAAEKDRAFNQSIDMAEKSVALLELKESLEQERERSEQLLRNILPERVIRVLQREGASKPELFDNVTVFFSDIVGFTRMSAELTPEAVIAELSDIFTQFDHIFTSHGCERIKTIGDAYLAVCGLPEPRPEHCANILRSALEARAYLERRNQDSPHQWRMRFGIHSGSVVGGIVGTEKYLYDIFGDTVNTAARMEQLSEPMRINVSETVRNLAPADCVFTPRPPQEVKGKGEMKMFFLDR